MKDVQLFVQQIQLYTAKVFYPFPLTWSNTSHTVAATSFDTSSWLLTFAPFPANSHFDEYPLITCFIPVYAVTRNTFSNPTDVQSTNRTTISSFNGFNSAVEGLLCADSFRFTLSTTHFKQSPGPKVLLSYTFFRHYTQLFSLRSALLSSVSLCQNKQLKILSFCFSIKIFDTGNFSKFFHPTTFLTCTQFFSLSSTFHSSL